MIYNCVKIQRKFPHSKNFFLKNRHRPLDFNENKRSEKRMKQQKERELVHKNLVLKMDKTKIFDLFYNTE